MHGFSPCGELAVVASCDVQSSTHTQPGNPITRQGCVYIHARVEAISDLGQTPFAATQALLDQS